MDKFLEGYQKRGAKPTARGDENEVAVDTELKGASPEKVQGSTRYAAKPEEVVNSRKRQRDDGETDEENLRYGLMRRIDTGHAGHAGIITPGMPQVPRDKGESKPTKFPDVESGSALPMRPAQLETTSRKRAREEDDDAGDLDHAVGPNTAYQAVVDTSITAAAEKSAVLEAASTKFIADAERDAISTQAPENEKQPIIKPVKRPAEVTVDGLERDEKRPRTSLSVISGDPSGESTSDA